MAKIEVTVEVSATEVQDALWLFFGREEFAIENCLRQSTLMRMRDFNLLESRIESFAPGFAHCYFVAKEKDGEAVLDSYLAQM